MQCLLGLIARSSANTLRLLSRVWDCESKDTKYLRGPMIMCFDICV